MAYLLMMLTKLYAQKGNKYSFTLLLVSKGKLESGFSLNIVE